MKAIINNQINRKVFWIKVKCLEKFNQKLFKIDYKIARFK